LICFDAAEKKITALRVLAASRGGSVVVATTADEVRAAQARGALAMLFGVEGGHMLGPGTPEGTQLDHLRRLHALGARYLTLTWAVSNDLGGSSGDDGDGTGLTPFGRKVMAEMERLGMMIDLSHVSDPLFWDALRAARRPVLLSHSSSRALANVPRNITDAMARAVAKNGGAICVNFNPSFLDADYAHRQAPLWAAAKSLSVEQASKYMAAESKKLPPVPLAKLVEHVVHLVEVAGPDHVCLGSDFDGIPSLPAGLESAADLPKLVALLAEKLEPRTLAQITSENVLRVLAANEAPHTPVRQP
jgi:membrane dipeptidase